jgi:hypothetical protein
MKHLWSIVCKQAIINNETKTLSIIDVIEEITFHVSANLPKEKITFPCDFEIVSYWIREDINKEKDVDFLLEIIDPNGEKIGGANGKMAFPLGEKRRMRTIIKSKTFVYTTEGQYLFKIKLNEEKKEPVAEIPIEVRLQTISEAKK